jgi:hypothetical protein
MRIPAPGTIVVALLAVTFVALIAIGHPLHNDQETTPAPATTAAPAAQSSSISVNGVTLQSVSLDFPDDTDSYPAGPHSDVINNDCRACHSPSMALYQPRLSAEEWHKEVEKMRNTFGAPVPEKDVPDIVAYLADMSAKRAQ